MFVRKIAIDKLGAAAALLAAGLVTGLGACTASLDQLQSSLQSPSFLSDRQSAGAKSAAPSPAPATAPSRLAAPTVEQLALARPAAVEPKAGAGDANRAVARASAGGAMHAASHAARKDVAFGAPYPAGAIVVANDERALYFISQQGRAIRYRVAIGVFEQEWTGLEFVSDKRENPTWYPVAAPGEAPREPVPGGDPTNPLGPRALYLGRTLWRIHGTPAPGSIGQAVSNGCIRMRNEDILDLYSRVPLGTEVYVVFSLRDPPPQARGRKLMPEPAARNQVSIKAQSRLNDDASAHR